MQIRVIEERPLALQIEALNEELSALVRALGSGHHKRAMIAASSLQYSCWRLAESARWKMQQHEELNHQGELELDA